MGLPLDVGEILVVAARFRNRCFVRSRHSRSNLRFAIEKGGHLFQAARPEHFDALDDRRFGRIGRGYYQPFHTVVPSLDGYGQDAPHGFDRAVERQFARKQRIGQRSGLYPPHGRQNPHGNRQVERSALLAQVGRGQVDHHFLARHVFAGVLERRPDALLALLHGVVGKPHQVEPQPAARDVDLDGHRHGVDTDDCPCECLDEHGA